ncbi:hypothetical protein KJF94_29695 [Pseudomonas hormoni]|uniref:Uncharacterized protein n=1 Tax=Pseudomonas hormoni TaxID=3093767 RepID=A0ABX8EW54_9PSED|nr:hypothetical protein [Pseudomonas hormoni]QVW23949.1 hypothetical protein KJF94_29695 [Pseudomonas hormoni]
MNKMNEVELSAYFDQCLEACQAKLKLIGPKIQSRSAAAVQLPIDRDELNAAIMGSGIVGFLEGMTRRNKRIVKNTYAYADIASRLLFPNKVDKVARYEAFKKLMFAMGWTEYNSAFTYYKSTTSKLTMDNVALDIVYSAIGGAAGPAGAALKVVAEKTIEALKKQPDAVKLFERHAIEASGANFGVSVCKQDDEAEVTMAVGTVRYDTSANNTKVIFFDWNSSDVEIYRGKALFTIHEEDLRKEAAAIKFLDDLREAVFMEFSPV